MEVEVEPADLRPEAKLGEDLGLDSLDGVDHVVALEQAINRDALNFENTVDERILELLDASNPARRMARRFGSRWRPVHRWCP